MPSPPAGVKTPSGANITTLTALAAPVLDARKVADLVRQLAEARREVRTLQAALQVRDVPPAPALAAGAEPLTRSYATVAEVIAEATSPAPSSIAGAKEAPAPHPHLQQQHQSISQVVAKALPSRPHDADSAANGQHSPLPPPYEEIPGDGAEQQALHGDYNGGRCHRYRRSRHHSQHGRSHSDRGWQQRYLALRLRYERLRLRRARELGEIQRLVDAIGMEQEYARLHHQQQQLDQQQSQQKVLGDGHGQRLPMCTTHVRLGGLNDATTVLSMTPAERSMDETTSATPKRSAARAAQVLPSSSQPNRAPSPQRQSPNPDHLQPQTPQPPQEGPQTYPESLEVTAVSRFSEVDMRPAFTEHASSPVAPPAGGVLHSLEATVPQLRSELAMWREQCLQLLLAQQQQQQQQRPGATANGSTSLVDEEVKAESGHQLLNTHGAGGAHAVSDFASPAPLQPTSASATHVHAPPPPPPYQSRPPTAAEQQEQPYSPPPLPSHGGLFMQPYAGAAAIAAGVPYRVPPYTTGVHQMEGTTVPPQPYLPWGPSGSALPAAWYHSGETRTCADATPPANLTPSYSTYPPFFPVNGQAYLPSPEELLQSYTTQARRLSGRGFVASPAMPGATAAATPTAATVAISSSSAPEAVPVREGERQHGNTPSSTAPGTSTSTYTPSSLTSLASTTGTNAMSSTRVLGNAHEQPPRVSSTASSRDALERDIQRHNQLLVAITRLQYTAAERTARTPAPNAY